MAPSLPLDKGGIISTVVEGILYGFSVFMFGVCLWVLLYRRSTRRVNHTMVVISSLLFIFSTMVSLMIVYVFFFHIVVDIQRLIQGLVDNRTFPMGGPSVWFEDVSQFTFVFKSAIFSFQTFTGDAVVIYRCYIVWQSIYVIILPFLMLLGVAVTAAGSVYACSRATLVQGGIFFENTDQWITSFYAATLSTNMLSTLLLAYRIWSIGRRATSRQSSATLTSVLCIVIDAGVLYSVTLLSALLAFVYKSNGQFVILDMITPIISIAFYMVIIRIGVSSVTSQCSNTSQFMANPPTDQSQGDEEYALRPLEVRITQFIESRNRDGQVVSDYLSPAGFGIPGKGAMV
ncbi:hypothetical protein BV25DRAFT_1814183 [Artomyces pyxidatus]|uniref:Uncharacterized protein n=1 Tax=Artomyces pyxidatus TaxID=48021 RepID=A0ACB8SKM3_9AGAM|nr:hypothetical protein BV25DRAFT_1814183 [Artomyces pyxidatus]